MGEKYPLYVDGKDDSPSAPVIRLRSSVESVVSVFFGPIFFIVIILWVAIGWALSIAGLSAGTIAVGSVPAWLVGLFFAIRPRVEIRQDKVIVQNVLHRHVLRRDQIAALSSCDVYWLMPRAPTRLLAFAVEREYDGKDDHRWDDNVRIPIVCTALLVRKHDAPVVRLLSQVAEPDSRVSEYGKW